LGAHGQNYLQPGEWQTTVAYRWFRSDRHFRGRHEEPERQSEGSEVINNVHTLDLTGTYAYSKRFSVSLTLPFAYMDRSSLYEHDRVNRHTTRAYGLGDLRLTGHTWLLDPDTHLEQNIGVGLGVKAPTGDYKVRDTFHKASGPVSLPVDQSIQLGDGGWGIILELQGFKKLYPRIYAYLNGTYLINPRNVNHVETGRSRANERIMSVPDQYLGRVGLTYVVWPEKGVSLSLGGRIEGVPVRDLIGRSDGFRRPGYSISIEPGVSWVYGANTLTMHAPVALLRDRQRSVTDLQNSRLTGNRVHGDAAFSDFMILMSYSRRF
jgi:hypothetical protein